MATGLTGAGLAGESLRRAFGGASRDGEGDADPSQFTFDKYPDYTFIDPYLNPNVAREIA